MSFHFWIFTFFHFFPLAMYKNVKLTVFKEKGATLIQGATSISDSIVSNKYKTNRNSHLIKEISYTPCPTDHYPYYQLIDNKCFYFEYAKLSHDEAQSNCMEKLANYGGGKLFEPQSLSENVKVAGFGSVALDSYWGNAWPWIGAGS